MKKMLVVTIALLSMTGCTKTSIVDYINEKTDIDISDCNIIIDKNTQDWFHGDGEHFVKANCSNASEKLLKQVKSWNELPFSENIGLIMYGGTKDGINYGYELANKIGIPKIENGYYLFIDRHDESKGIHDDSELLDRGSFNFSLVIYDKDSNIFYYYTFDT
ncbi:MAG: hypothetical protein IJ105_02970 [Bacilli bacterium]|nr:hypothetical protein [Bacilli bacterium]